MTALTSIKYDDTDDTEQTYSSANYWTDLLSVPARVQVKTSWPSTKVKPGAVRIRLAAGYATVTEIPAVLLHAVKLLVGHWYENREATNTLTIKDIPLGIDALLMSRAEYHFYR